MTWTVIIVTVLLSLVKLLVTCLPTSTVEWLLSKFETHSKLSKENVILSVDGRQVEGEETKRFVQLFNEANFLKKHYIWPGSEEAYLNPEGSQTPVIIHDKRGTKNVRILVYIYKDRVDVVKQYKKKLIAYSLASENLQNCMKALIRED